MKIKRKVEMNLPQLIEWVWDNNVKNERYRCSDSNPYEYVWINENSDVELDEDMRISKNDNFTVEVEEVVDSDTVLDNIYTVNVEVGTSHTTYYKSRSINDVKTDEINIIYTILQEEAIVLWDSQGGFR